MTIVTINITLKINEIINKYTFIYNIRLLYPALKIQCCPKSKVLFKLFSSPLITMVSIEIF